MTTVCPFRTSPEFRFPDGEAQCWQCGQRESAHIGRRDTSLDTLYPHRVTKRLQAARQRRHEEKVQ